MFNPLSETDLKTSPIIPNGARCIIHFNASEVASASVSSKSLIWEFAPFKAIPNIKAQDKISI